MRHFWPEGPEAGFAQLFIVFNAALCLIGVVTLDGWANDITGLAILLAQAALWTFIHDTLLS